MSPRLESPAFARLSERDNVKLLPALPRERIPPFIAHLDCGLLSYRESAWTEHGSPLKLWDYLGAGIPIAGSGYKILTQFPPPLVRFASPSSDLPEALVAALAGSGDEREDRRRHALSNTWTDRAAQLAVWLDELPVRAATSERRESILATVGPQMVSSLRSLRNRTRRLFVDTVPKRHRARLQALSRPAVALLYRGSELECPVCGGRFRRMQGKRQASGRVRENAQCPRCGALERHRLLWLFLRQETDLMRTPSRLLHIAPEPGIERHLRAAPSLDYLTGDLNSPPAMVAVDIGEMPFEDERFDAVICNHVLEHVPDDRRAMREIRRVLRPGGWAVLSVPWEEGRATTLEDPDIVAPAERERIYGQFDHLRLYGRDYPDRLAEAGFEVERRRYPAELGDSAVARFALMPDDEIVFCRRP